jgi:4-hydroxy-2-oxoheptanedioate aldolase
VRDLAHAQEVTEYAKFAPRGTRGVGYGRTQRYQGANNSFFKTENQQRHCYAMIETAQAFADTAAIAALPCVDGLFVGPANLSMARGRGAFSASDADLADLRHIAATAIMRESAGRARGKTRSCARQLWHWPRAL